MTQSEESSGEDDQETWTAEEIEAWEDENEGVCPAFRVDHRPERERVRFDSEDDDAE